MTATRGRRGLARGRHRGRRRAHRPRRASSCAPARGGCSASCCGRTGGRCGWLLATDRRPERSPGWPGRCLIGVGIDVAVPGAGRRRPLAAGRGSPRRWSAPPSLDAVLRYVFLTGSGRVGPGGAADPAPAGVHPRPAAAAVLPRAVHLGQDDQPADQRRRGAGRAARRGPRRPAHRAVQRARRSASSCWCSTCRWAWSRCSASRRCTWWPAGSSATRRSAYRRTRETIAALIVQFTETFGGIRAVQAFRREPRNDELLRRAQRGQPAGPRPGVLADRRLRPGGDADRQPGHRRRPGLRRAAGDRRRPRGRRRWSRSCCTCGGSSTRCRTSRCSTTPTSRRPRRWRSSPGCWRRRPACRRAGRPGAAARRRAASCVFDDVRFGYSDAHGAARGSTWPSRPGRRWRWSAPPAPASRRWPGWRRGSTTRVAGEVAARRRPAAPAGRRRPAPGAW